MISAVFPYSPMLLSVGLAAMGLAILFYMLLYSIVLSSAKISWYEAPGTIDEVRTFVWVLAGSLLFIWGSIGIAQEMLRFAFALFVLKRP